jgi:hypothetical protein
VKRLTQLIFRAGHFRQDNQFAAFMGQLIGFRPAAQKLFVGFSERFVVDF